MFVAVALLYVGLAAIVTADDSGDALGYGLPGLPPRSRRIVSGLSCQNTAAFALTGALEIGYQRLTGKTPVKLAEQEIIDCFSSGCFEPKFGINHLAKWLTIQQRLSAEAEYSTFFGAGDLGNKNKICRAAQSPNALEVELKLENSELTPIKPDEVTMWLEKSGFVFAMISTSKDKCPGYYNRKSKLLNKLDAYWNKYRDSDKDGFIDGYEGWLTGAEGHVVDGESTVYTDSNVLIVGTHKDGNDEYYVVRDSRGDIWMRRGHFLIRKGGNICGIENHLKSAEVVLVEREGHDPVTNCPEHSPKWCAETKTCTGASQDCVANETPDLLGYDPETSAPANKAKVWDFSGRPECQDKANYESTCSEIAKTWKNCMNEKVQKVCAGSCLVCARDTCEDHGTIPGQCEQYSRFCKVAGVMAMCGKTCQIHPSDCGSMEVNIYLLSGLTKPSMGSCYAPVIENGRVLNSGMLQNGDKLEIECDSGFNLVGEQNYCVLQDMYGPDSRIMQACVQTGGEHWNGNGKNYNGNNDKTVQQSPCKNWREVLAKGTFNPTRLEVSYGRAAMKQGSSLNHNYCRNPEGAAPVPWCFASDIDLNIYGDMEIIFTGMDPPDDGILRIDTSEVMYCELLPRCGGDYCANAANDPVVEIFCYSDNPKGACSLDKISNEWMQWYCPRMCCAEASKCEETPEDSGFVFDFGDDSGFGDGGDDSGFGDGGDDFGGDDSGFDDFGDDSGFDDFGDDSGFDDFGDDSGFSDFGGDDGFGDFGGDDFGGDDSGFGDFGGDDFGGDDFGGDDFGGDDFGGDDFGGDDFGGDDFGGDDFGGDDFGGDDFGGDDFGGDDFGGDDFGGDDFGGDDFGGDDFGGDDFGGDDFGGDDGFGDFGDFGFDF